MQIEPKMVQNPDFPVVLRCAACQSRRAAKSRITKNQRVRISMRNRRRAKTGGFADFSLARVREVQKLSALWKRLLPLRTDKMPLDAAPPRASRFGSPLVLSRVHWVRPELVVEVTYLTWTDDGLLRQVIYEGLREGETDRTEHAAPDPFGSDIAGLSRNEAALGLGEHGDRRGVRFIAVRSKPDSIVAAADQEYRREQGGRDGKGFPI